MNRLACLCLLLLCWSCEDMLVPDHTDARINQEDFEAAWNHINAIYPLFEFKEIDWQSVYTDFSQRTAATSGDDFNEVLYDLVAELQDPHASVLTLGGTRVRPYNSPRLIRSEGTFSPNILRKYFDEPLIVTANKAIEYQHLRPNIGYIRISTFGNKLRGYQHLFADIIRYFASSEGLIIDVRENNGGSSDVYVPIVSHLLTAPVTTGYQYSVDGFVAPAIIEPHPTTRFEGKIAVLINGTSFSAAEVFSDYLRGPERVRLIGDTTAGGGMSSNSSPRFELPSGRAISLNYSAVLRKDSVVLEWNGVPPDILVLQTVEDIKQGRDKILEAAIAHLENN